MKESKKALIPLPKAVLAIFISVCLIFGFSVAGIFFYKHINGKKHADPAYDIVAVVQTSQNPGGFKTAFFVELLDLSIDHPQNLYSFNFKDAELKLLKASVLKSVKVRKIFPGTVHIEYTKREPIAYYSDYTNTAIDAEGYIFPFKPYFTLKRLPKIITGYDLKEAANEDCEGESIWGRKINNRFIDLSFDILQLSPLFCDGKSQLLCVDVSRAFANTIGEREVVLTLEDRIVKVKDGRSIVCIYPRLLRLSPNNYSSQLANYITFKDYLREIEGEQVFQKEGTLELPLTIIDLRITDVALFHKEV